MEIPIYTAPETDNAISEGEFEIAGFRSFIQTIVKENLYDKEKFDGLFAKILEQGTADLQPEEMLALQRFVNGFNAVCKRCGAEFTWDEIDPRNEIVYCSNCQHDLENL